MENKQNQTGESSAKKMASTKYWNGKTSDLPIIQRMIEADNKKFQIGPNKFNERMKENN